VSERLFESGDVAKEGASVGHCLRTCAREAVVDPAVPVSLLTIKDVVAYTRVSEKTIRRAIRDSKLRAFKPPGGLRFRLEDVDEWLELFTVEPDPPQQGGRRRTLSEVLA
jgi:excisionase family DNA binding protein